MCYCHQQFNLSSAPKALHPSTSTLAPLSALLLFAKLSADAAGSLSTCFPIALTPKPLIPLPISVYPAQVPADAAIAVRLMAKQQSEAAEREQIKALVLEANQRDEAEQQAAAAAAAAQRAAAAGSRRGYRSGGRGHGGLYKYQTPAGAARGAQPGPKLTLRQHVSQLTGETE